MHAERNPSKIITTTADNIQPLVFIQGHLYRTITRASALVLTGNVDIQFCDKNATIDSKSELNYKWEVNKQSLLSPNIFTVDTKLGSALQLKSSRLRVSQFQLD